MTSTAWTFPDEFFLKFEDDFYVWDSDTFAIVLLDSTSNIGAASTTYSGLTGELATGNGYTHGGTTVALTRSGTRTIKTDSTDVTWTATGGTLTARWAALIDVTKDRVVCYTLMDDTPADVQAIPGVSLAIVIDTLGVFDLAAA